MYNLPNHENSALGRVIKRRLKERISDETEVSGTEVRVNVAINARSLGTNFHQIGLHF